MADRTAGARVLVFIMWFWGNTGSEIRSRDSKLGVEARYQSLPEHYSSSSYLCVTYLHVLRTKKPFTVTTLVKLGVETSAEIAIGSLERN